MPNRCTSSGLLHTDPACLGCECPRVRVLSRRSGLPMPRRPGQPLPRSLVRPTLRSPPVGDPCGPPAVATARSDPPGPDAARPPSCPEPCERGSKRAGLPARLVLRRLCGALALLLGVAVAANNRRVCPRAARRSTASLVRPPRRAVVRRLVGAEWANRTSGCKAWSELTEPQLRYHVAVRAGVCVRARSLAKPTFPLESGLRIACC